MSISFRKAVRSSSSLFVALAGQSGSGKTLTALKLARGIVGPTGKIAFIDTEGGRALHYADMVDFDHAVLGPPFRPAVFWEAIKSAQDAGYGVAIIDSMSHEHRGDGGVLDWFDDEIERVTKGDASKAEKMKGVAWIKPKGAHKRLISDLTTLRISVIFCLRAEPKTGYGKDREGKTIIIDKGLQPICDSQFMYEVMTSFMMDADQPGVGIPIKLEEQHKHCFPEGKQIGEESGKLLAAWARGEAAAEKSAKQPDTPELDPTVLAVARDVASLGAERFREHWKGLSAADRAMLKPHVEDLKSRAEKADNATQKESA